MIKPLLPNTSIRSLHPKASCKRMQHCQPTAPNIVECYMLRPLAHSVAFCCDVVGSCCTKFETGQTFRHVQMDTTTLNIVGPTMLGVVMSICT